MGKRKQKNFIVEMRVKRVITVYVDAIDEEEAERKAKEWEIVGDEEPGETIDMEVTGVRINE